MEKNTQATGTTQEEFLGLPDREQSRGHYMTPPDFFSQLNERILTNLPEAEEQTPEVISWWVKARPIVYLAACFVGLMLCFKVVQGFQPQETSLPNEQSAELEANLEEEEWMLYYSDYVSHEETHEQEVNYALADTF